MVHLKEIDETNLEECLDLERKKKRFVGNSYDVLAEAYIHRSIATAYGIYNEDIIVGMIVVLDRPKHQNYSFNNLFIADNYQGCGYGIEAVRCTVEMVAAEGKYSEISILVHNSNRTARKIYEKVGFVISGNAKWDKDFLCLKMQI